MQKKRLQQVTITTLAMKKQEVGALKQVRTEMKEDMFEKNVNNLSYKIQIAAHIREGNERQIQNKRLAF